MSPSSSPIHHPSSFSPAVVILAAGHSSRMGRPKPFLEYRGRTFVETLVANALAAGAGSIVVVAHPAHRDSYAACPLSRCILVENPNPDRGMLSSLRIGVEQLPGDATHAVFCPVDCPAILPATWERVVEECSRARGQFVRPTYKGEPGHPAAIPAEFFAALAAWSAPGGACAFMESMRGSLREIAVDDPAILRDVDTPEDYEALRHG